MLVAMATDVRETSQQFGYLAGAHPRQLEHRHQDSKQSCTQTNSQYVPCT